MNESAKAGCINTGKFKVWMLNNAIYIVFIVLFTIFVVIDPTIFSINSIQTILSQSSTRIIMALGVGGIIVLGGTDLSVGRMIGMAAVISASLLQDPNSSRRVFPNLPEIPVMLPILLVMAICAFFTSLHGLAVFKLQVPPFIAALGLQLVVYGAESMYYQEANNASPISNLSKKFTNLAQGGFVIGNFKISYLVLLAAICVAAMWVVWNKTIVGRNMFAIGGNREAAIVSGVNILKYAMFVYIMAGLLYGFAGSLEAARTGSATNALGTGYECDAISACVVGGVSMRGGIGTIPGIVIGALLFQLINFGLVYMGVSPFMQYIVKGFIIIVAVAIDTQKYVKKK